MDDGGGSKVISLLQCCRSEEHLPSQSRNLFFLHLTKNKMQSREPDWETGAVVDMFYTWSDPN